MSYQRHRPPDQRRKRSNEFSRQTVWLFGLHSVDAALRNPVRVKHRLILTRNAAVKLRDAISLSGVRFEEADARKFPAPIDRNSVHQGAALEVSPLEPASLETILQLVRPGVPVVLLDRVTDPHNVGAIIRSAAAFGAAGLIAPARHAPPETGALAKSAAGSFELVPYLRVRNLGSAMEQAQNSGVCLLGFDSASGISVNAASKDFSDQPVGLVFGSEGKGLRAGTKDRCDSVVSIAGPQGQVSLNVSNAAAIALHAFVHLADED